MVRPAGFLFEGFMVYPKWLYGESGAVLLKSQTEENELKGNWFDSPTKVSAHKIQNVDQVEKDNLEINELVTHQDESLDEVNFVDVSSALLIEPIAQPEPETKRRGRPPRVANDNSN